MAHFFIRPHYQYDPKWCAWFEDSLIDQSASISFPFSLFHCDVTDYSGGLMSLCTVHFYIYPGKIAGAKYTNILFYQRALTRLFFTCQMIHSVNILSHG